MNPLHEILNANPIDHLEFWNHPTILSNNNCYSYAINAPFGFHASAPVPGLYRNDKIISYFQSYDKFQLNLKSALISDGCEFINSNNEIPATPNDHYLIGCFTRQIAGDQGYDFHFMRNHKSSQWSHKNGINGQTSFIDKPIEYADNLMKIYDPRGDKIAPVFLGWFSVPLNGLGISTNEIFFEINDKNPRALQYSFSEKIIRNKLENQKRYLDLQNNPNTADIGKILSANEKIALSEIKLSEPKHVIISLRKAYENITR